MEQKEKDKLQELSQNAGKSSDELLKEAISLLSRRELGHKRYFFP